MDEGSAAFCVGDERPDAQLGAWIAMTASVATVVAFVAIGAVVACQMMKQYVPQSFTPAECHAFCYMLAACMQYILWGCSIKGSCYNYGSLAFICKFCELADVQNSVCIIMIVYPLIHT